MIPTLLGHVLSKTCSALRFTQAWYTVACRFPQSRPMECPNIASTTAKIGAVFNVIISIFSKQVRKGLKKANEEETLKLLAKGKRRPRQGTPADALRG